MSLGLRLRNPASHNHTRFCLKKASTVKLENHWWEKNYRICGLPFRGQTGKGVLMGWRGVMLSFCEAHTCWYRRPPKRWYTQKTKAGSLIGSIHTVFHLVPHCPSTQGRGLCPSGSCSRKYWMQLISWYCAFWRRGGLWSQVWFSTEANSPQKISHHTEEKWKDGF